MRAEDMKKHDTVFLKDGFGPKIGTVLSVNVKKQTVRLAYRTSAFGYSKECVGTFKAAVIAEIAERA